MKNDRLAKELSQLASLYKSLVEIAENLRANGDRPNSQAVQDIAFGLQTSQLNILASLVNDPSRNKQPTPSRNIGVF